MFDILLGIDFRHGDTQSTKIYAIKRTQPIRPIVDKQQNSITLISFQ